MSIALASRPKLRFSGRSLLAFVIEPVPPLGDWLAEFDDVVRQSFGFFANRPVIVNLAGLAANRTDALEIIDALKARAIRIVSVEGVDPTWLDLSLAPLAATKTIDLSGFGDLARESETPEPPPPAKAMIIDKPVRSGQSIVHNDGDIIITESVSSGAEVIAAGSIHIYGTLRGRALAGAMGAKDARIFCRRLEAELVAMNGCYLTAETIPPETFGKPVQIRLERETVKIVVTD